MAIPIEKEPPDLYENTRVYECCVFCRKETMYWHRTTNNPVCENCSGTHQVSELKNWRSGAGVSDVFD